jgi:hypothetical protein
MASTNGSADVDASLQTGNAAIDGLMTEFHWSTSATANFFFTIPDSAADYRDTRLGGGFVNDYPDDNFHNVAPMPPSAWESRNSSGSSPSTSPNSPTTTSIRSCAMASLRTMAGRTPIRPPIRIRRSTPATSSILKASRTTGSPATCSTTRRLSPIQIPPPA